MPEVEKLLRWDNQNPVETVVLLSDKRVDGHIDIDLDVEKLESKGGRATYAEIKDYCVIYPHNLIDQTTGIPYTFHIKA